MVGLNLQVWHQKHPDPIIDNISQLLGSWKKIGRNFSQHFQIKKQPQGWNKNIPSEKMKRLKCLNKPIYIYNIKTDGHFEALLPKDPGCELAGIRNAGGPEIRCVDQKMIGKICKRWPHIIHRPFLLAVMWVY